MKREMLKMLNCETLARAPLAYITHINFMKFEDFKLHTSLQAIIFRTASPPDLLEAAAGRLKSSVRSKSSSVKSSGQDRLTGTLRFSKNYAGSSKPTPPLWPLRCIG